MTFTRPLSSHTRSGPLGALRRLGDGLQVLLVGTALVVVGALAVSFLRAVAHSKPEPLPSTMETVDWHDPASSIYCLACHRQVAPAMAGLNVQRGHSQNVPLNDLQRQAVADMGTTIGPQGTLICMSCHELGTHDQPYMLADTLAGSQLCQRCHPGHYAQGTPHDLRQSAPTECNRLGQTVAQAGPCSACHLAHSYAREIVPSPLDPDGWCVTCHRAYHVAAGHAREHMEHPESHCIQCHNPHDMTHGEFLREASGPLCLRCHEDLGGGVAVGMHPLGNMDYPVPQELVDAGAQVGDDAQELTCRVCHSTHHSNNEALLLNSPQTNVLCLACHAEKLAEDAHGSLPRHGQSPKLTAEQRSVVAEFGNRVGPDNELLCVSCHKVHGAQPATALLTFKPKYGETCVACHPEQATVLGSSHDLQTNFPGEKNLKGMTPVGAGPCSACHLAHRTPRDHTTAAGDPDGECVTCHQAGSVGQTKVAGTNAHPQTQCTACHNPHDRSYGNYLAKPEDELCASCHADHTKLVGGPHDATRPEHAEKWPADVTAAPGLCRPCHIPHGEKRPDLFRVGDIAPARNHDDVCLACHADLNWGSATGVAAVHPQQIAPEHCEADVALVPLDERGGERMGCRTCHDPHGGAEPVHLARVRPGEDTHDLCLRCHTDKEYMKYTKHSAVRLAEFGFDVDSCKPCHAAHADASGAWGQLLSPRFLMAYCTAEDNQGVSCVPCLACHRPNGPAPVRTVATHPDLIMMNIVEPGKPGYLPLFNEEGREDPGGQVACRTCHVSHGRLDLLQRLAANPMMSAEERHALRAQVRPFVEPNVCTACHGNDARQEFLRFHNPEWRAQRKRLPDADQFLAPSK